MKLTVSIGQTNAALDVLAENAPKIGGILKSAFTLKGFGIATAIGVAVAGFGALVSAVMNWNTEIQKSTNHAEDYASAIEGAATKAEAMAEIGKQTQDIAFGDPDSIKASTDAIDAMGVGWIEVQNAISGGSDALGEYLFETNAARIANGEFSEEEKDAIASAVVLWQDAARSAESALGNWTAAAQATAKANAEAEAAVQSEQDMAKALEDAAKAHDDFRAEVSKAFASFISGQAAFAQMEQAAEEWGKSNEGAVKRAGSAWDAFNRDSKTSMRSFIGILREQAADQAEYSESMGVLSDRLGALAPKSTETVAVIISELAKLGPEGAAQAKMLSEATDSQLNKVVELYALRADAAAQAFTEKMDVVASPLIDVNADMTKATTTVNDWLRVQAQRQLTITVARVLNQTSRGVPQFAEGRGVTGPGTGTSDSIPALLSNGEWVSKASTVSRAGGFAGMQRLTDAIDNGWLRFATGGPVASPGVQHVESELARLRAEQARRAEAKWQEDYRRGGVNNPSDATRAKWAKADRERELADHSLQLTVDRLEVELAQLQAQDQARFDRYNAEAQQAASQARARSDVAQTESDLAAKNYTDVQAREEGAIKSSREAIAAAIKMTDDQVKAAESNLNSVIKAGEELVNAAKKAGEERIRDAQSQLKDAESFLTEMQRAQDEANKEWLTAMDALSAKNTQIRRDQNGVGSLSDAYAAVDDLIPMSRMLGVPESLATWMRDLAVEAETGLRAKFELQEQLNKSLERHNSLLADAQGLRDRTVSSMRSALSLAAALPDSTEFDQHVQGFAVWHTDPTPTAGDRLRSQLSEKLSRAARFNSALDRLMDANLPPSIINAVLAEGLEGGPELADAILSMGATGMASYAADWEAFEAATATTGDLAVKAGFGTSIAAIQNGIDDLTGSIADSERAVSDWASLIEAATLGALHEAESYAHLQASQAAVATQLAEAARDVAAARVTAAEEWAAAETASAEKVAAANTALAQAQIDNAWAVGAAKEKAAREELARVELLAVANIQAAEWAAILAKQQAEKLAVEAANAEWQAQLVALRGYAEGGIEDHQAQIAPGGAWRVWAEKETGGEAYIPLAESKRARSIAILEDVAARFGAKVIPAAEGYVAPPITTHTWGAPQPVGPSSVTLSPESISQLARALEGTVFEMNVDGQPIRAIVGRELGKVANRIGQGVRR
jgi:hypothetical protein